tara:strand:- start:245 stop:448 length:204 start_codon:yes stop_codon:yes gene_type:complete
MTVGFDDYSGSTTIEYILAIILEFIGLTFFGFIMGSIAGLFASSENFDDYVRQKLDDVNMWVRLMEK